MRTPTLYLLVVGMHVPTISSQNPCYEVGVRCNESRRRIVNTGSMFKRGAGVWDSQHRCPSEINMNLLEDLWAEKHFRGPYNGPDSYLRRVPPHYLGNHVNFSKCRRKVYLDIGAGHFTKGFMSMLKIYPHLASFDEFYAFEAVPGRYRLPPEVLPVPTEHFFVAFAHIFVVVCVVSIH